MLRSRETDFDLNKKVLISVACHCGQPFSWYESATNAIHSALLFFEVILHFRSDEHKTTKQKKD